MAKPGHDEAAGIDGSAAAALLKAGRFFTRWDETDDGRAVFREGGRRGRRFLSRPVEPRQGRALDPWG
jgi:nitrate reductase alpha subunit